MFEDAVVEGNSHLDPEFSAALAARAKYRSKELAELLGLGTRQLQRRFRDALGCRPKDWLDRQRSVAALRGLAEADAIKEVAYDLGFKQLSHFSRWFKRLHGCTPSEYVAARRGTGGETGPAEPPAIFILPSPASSLRDGARGPAQSPRGPTQGATSQG